MPTRFVEVWLGGNSYLPLPRAYPQEPYRLYVNRLRGFFAKHAPDYPALDADLTSRAYAESQYLARMSSRRGAQYRGPSLRSAQMSLAQRQAYIQRRQRQMGFKVTSFAPTSRSASILVPETKYFDVGIQTTVTTAGTTWADTEVFADNYVNSSGTPAAYTDAALIPSAQGSGYGQINGNRYKLKKIRVRGNIYAAPLVDQNDAPYPVTARLLLIMDTQPNGTQAQGETIMQDFGAAGENIHAFKAVSSASGCAPAMSFVVPGPSVCLAVPRTPSRLLHSSKLSFVPPTSVHR